MATISLGSNTTSMQAQSELATSTSALVKSYQRLSSGLRINDAADDAAGLAIVSQLNSKARVYTQAIRNVNDGVSAASIAEGALTALKDISQRQLELSEEAANGTYSQTQRQALNKEASALTDEYNRIAASTTFNGLNLFDPKLGTVLIQAGYGQAGSLQLGLSNQLQRAVGDGTFRALATVDLGDVAGPSAVITGDVNGDGNLDFVTADDNSGSVSVVLGNGNGTFRAAITFDADGGNLRQFPALQLADLNGDGKLDLVEGGAVAFGNGNGTFQKGVTFGSGDYTIVTVGDFNGDGKLDIAGSDYNGYSLNILLNNGNGTFKAPQSLAVPFATDTLSTGDFNGDGNMDLIDTSYEGTISLFLGTANGTLQSPKTFSGGLFSQSTLVADFNGDGNLDIVTGGTDVTLYTGNGNGTFRAGITQNVEIGDLHKITLGDVNNDGRMDIVDADNGTSVFVLLSNGDGTFQKTKTSPLGGENDASIATGDFDGDGRSDVVVSEYQYLGTNPHYSNQVNVLFGNGGYSSSSQYLNINTQQGARDAFNVVTANLNRIEGQLGVIGATTSQFQTELSNLQTRSENFEAAASQIQDVDVASESANLTRTQILQQAAASVLAQANQQPKIALTLLGD